MLSVYQPVDELRDIFTELVHEFLSGRLAILDGIMEKRGRDHVGLCCRAQPDMPTTLRHCGKARHRICAFDCRAC